MSFWYLQFSQKTNKKIRLYYYGISSWIVFIRFLGELKSPKRHLEINWPLEKYWKRRAKRKLNEEKAMKKGWKKLNGQLYLHVASSEKAWKCGGDTKTWRWLPLCVPPQGLQRPHGSGPAEYYLNKLCTAGWYWA